MPVKLVTVSAPFASKSPSGLNSVNSSPLQSNSSMLTVLGGSDRSYIVGAALMLAECSLVFTPPDKVGLALAAADLVLFEAVEGDVVGMCLAT